MPSAQHIILQQKFQLDFYETIGANNMAATISEWINDLLLPQMEKVLNDVDKPNCRIRIEAINIDAGKITGEDWQQLLAHEVCKQLWQKLREAAIVPVSLAVNIDNSAISFYSSAEKQKLVLYYLKTGALPWYAASLQGTELLGWLKALIETGYFNSDTAKLFLAEHPLAFHRFLLQTNTIVIDAWFSQWKRVESEDWLPAILLASRSWFGQNLNALVFTYAVLFDAAYPSSNPLWPLLLQGKFENTESAIHLVTKTKELILHTTRVEEWQQTVSEETLVKKEKSEKETTNVRKEYFINNAGLVLLHPFLKVFFANVDLLDDEGNWKDDSSHQRGVLLSNYICTGNIEMAEYNLPLCKLITGYPFHQPVIANVTITDKEEEETNALLTNVIDKWTILKTTSPIGLQNSFLTREGKLSLQENGWRLQVEQKTYDLLIDHLPWGFSIIKNNWMDKILFTEWM